MAPSPTGNLHLGGLRTALFNYLYARKHPEGKFILRIEDTDQTRLKEGAEDDILDSLAWAGLDFDEGPRKGGPCAPYTQSQRTELYQKYAHQLLESGHAYRCYCSADRLAEMRLSFSKKGLGSYYDRHCLSLAVNKKAWGKEEAEQYDEKSLAEKTKEEDEEYKDRPWVIRLKIPEGETKVKDIVLGDVIFKNAYIDDQVLLKSDGYPTYHLANVVDDHTMGITHVIRGEEWLNSSPKHQILYDAFGWETPEFVHLPLLLNPDKTKLSKRKGHVSDAGYLPTAVINFVVLLGWSPSDNKQIFYTTKEIIDEFSFAGVNKSGAIVDMAKLCFINGKHMQRLLEDNPRILADLTTRALQMYKENPEQTEQKPDETVNSEEHNEADNEKEGVEVKKVAPMKRSDRREVELSERYVLSVLNTTKDHFTTTNAIISDFDYLFFEPNFSSKPALSFKEIVRDQCLTKETKPITEVGTTYLNTLQTRLEQGTSEAEADQAARIKKIAQIINQATKDSKLDKKVAFYLLRYCLTGREKGMEVPTVISLLGMKETSLRFQRGLESL